MFPSRNKYYISQNEIVASESSDAAGMSRIGPRIKKLCFTLDNLGTNDHASNWMTCSHFACAKILVSKMEPNRPKK